VNSVFFGHRMKLSLLRRGLKGGRGLCTLQGILKVYAFNNHGLGYVITTRTMDYRLMKRHGRNKGIGLFHNYCKAHNATQMLGDVGADVN